MRVRGVSLIQYVEGYPIAIGNDGFVELGKFGDIALAVAGQDGLVEPGQDFKDRFFHSE